MIKKRRGNVACHPLFPSNTSGESCTKQRRDRMEAALFPVRLNGGDFFSVRHLPLRAEVTFYSVRDYANFRQLTPPFRKCRIFVLNVLLFAFRVRRCAVLYPIVFRYVSLIFPFVKGKTMGKRSNNDRINDDPSLSLHRAGIRSRYPLGAAIGRMTVGN